MKTKEKIKMVDIMREIRNKISNDIEDLTFEQLMEYLKHKKALHPAMFEKHREESA